NGGSPEVRPDDDDRRAARRSVSIACRPRDIHLWADVVVIAVNWIASPPRSDRLPQPRGPERGLIGASPLAAVRQLAVDDHGGDRADTQPLGTPGHVRVVHVQNTDVAGRAGNL